MPCVRGFSGKDETNRPVGAENRCMNPLSTPARTAVFSLAGLCLALAPPRCLAIAGDDFADAVDLGSFVPAEHARPATAALTLEPGEAEDVTGSHWLTWVCPAAGVYEARGTLPKRSASGMYVSGWDPVVRVYTGDALSTLSPVPYIPIGIVSEPKRFHALAGQRYRFRTGLTPFGGYLTNFSGGAAGALLFGGDLSGDFTFTLKKLSAAPPHDDFSGAAAVPAGDDVTVTGTNAGASNEPGEPLGPYEAGDSVWHRWTAGAAGNYELLLTSPAFVRVAVFSGETLATLTRALAAQPNYNNPALGTARLRWSAAAGETKFFRLTGNGYAQQGDYTLRLRRLSAPANDSLANAIPLAGALPLTASGSTADASSEAGIDAGSGSSPSSVWWKWTAAATGWAELRGDSAVGVFVNGAPLGYTLENSAPLRFRAVAGTVYHLRAATPEAAERTVTLSLSAITGLEHSDPENALDMGSGPSFTTPDVPVLGGLYVADRAGGVAYAALWCRWTAPVSGWVALDTEGSVGNPRLSVRSAAESATELRPFPLYQGNPSFGGGVFYNSADRTGSPFTGLFAPYPANPARRPLSESLVQDTSLAPDADRVLLRVTAGVSYLVQARPDASADSAPDAVRIRLRPASAPPAVLRASVRELRPASARDAHLLEITVAVSSPNGLVRGSCEIADRRVFFTDTDRIGGDTWSGEYRMVTPVPNGFSSAAAAGVAVTLADARGGFSAPSAESPVTPVSQPSALTDLTADTQPPIVEGAVSDAAVLTLADGLLTPVPVEAETIPLDGQPVAKVFRLGIRDFGGSGFAGGEILIGSAGGEFPATRAAPVSFGREQRVGGDDFLGIYEVPVTIPANARGGVLCRLRDHTGNVAGRWTGDSPWQFTDVRILGMPAGLRLHSFTDAVPLPYVLEQKGLADITAPVISDPAAILDAAGNIRLYARITDDLSGVARGAVTLADKFGLVEARVDFDSARRTGGTALDGRYEIILPAPRHGFGGAHYLSLRADDMTGMTAEARLIGPVTLPDRTAEDQRRPRLTRFQISPAAVNLTAGPAEIHVSIGAGDDRPGLAAVCRVFDSAGFLLAEKRVGCDKPVLDCAATLTLPARALLGPSAAARVELELADSAGRVETYGQPASPAWPEDAAVSLTLGPASEPFALWAASWPGLPALPPENTRDSDRDGVPDLLEFALGSDPLAGPAADVFRDRVPNLYITPVISLAEGEGGEPRPLLVTHQFSPAPSFTKVGDHYANGTWKLGLEESTDLTLWTPVPLTDRFADTGVVHTFRSVTPADPRRVLRLRVSP